MTLRTQLKATLESYLVEFDDETGTSVVEASHIDCQQPEIDSKVVVNQKYSATVIAYGKY